MMSRSMMLFFALFVSIYSNAADPFERQCLNGDRLKMHMAASKGDLDTIKGLIKAQGVECADGTGTTLLMIAAKSGQLGIAQFLIEKGASVNAKNNACWTPLHYAAGWGKSDIVDLLLQHDADKAVTSVLEQTPEQAARQRGNTDIADKIASYSRTKSAGKTE